MDEVERIRRALPGLPIFPLPGAVLLPHTLVPLHVFEPRYRKMTRDCQEGLRVMALANIPDGDAAAELPPRVEPVLGIGVLARVEPLPDGRFDIILRGVGRARIVEELESKTPYRVVRAEPLPPQVSPSDAAQADSLRRLVLALCAQGSGVELETLAQLAAKAHDPGDLADVVAGMLVESPKDRQAVLEAQSVSRRIEIVTQAAIAALAQSATTSAAPN
jgi:Lon protease-like protein